MKQIIEIDDDDLKHVTVSFEFKLKLSNIDYRKIILKKINMYFDSIDYYDDGIFCFRCHFSRLLFKTEDKFKEYFLTVIKDFSQYGEVTVREILLPFEIKTYKL